MGIIKQGILGGFRGTVGTVVGSSWRGKSIMRGKAQSIRNPRTQPQLDQRAKFVLVSNFIGRIKEATDIGYKNMAKGKSAYNAAFASVMKNAVMGTSPDFAIDYRNVAVAKGNLDNAPQMAVTSAQSGSIQLSWSDNSGTGAALADDNVLAVAYNDELGEAVISTADAVREDELLVLHTPASWDGTNAYVYLAFYSADGKRVSNSVQLGAVTVGETRD